MKSLTFLVAFLAITLSSTAQDVPQAAKTAFKQKYPEAKSVEWEKEGDNKFEAEFKSKGKEISVCFDKAGNWLETETEVSVRSLPKRATSSLAGAFGKYKIEEAEEVRRSDGKVLYELEIETKKGEWEVLVTADGQILKKESEDDDEEDDD